MHFGLSDKDYQILTNTLIKPFKEQGIQLWIFGSRARGDHHPYSDIDILYRLPNNPNLPQAFISKHLEEIENSNLTVKVDLVDEKNLASSYKNGVMKDRVLI